MPFAEWMLSKQHALWLCDGLCSHIVHACMGFFGVWQSACTDTCACVGPWRNKRSLRAALESRAPWPVAAIAYTPACMCLHWAASWCPCRRIPRKRGHTLFGIFLLCVTALGKPALVSVWTALSASDFPPHT